RCQHQLTALAQQPNVEAVLVHHRETLDPLLLRPGLVDEHDAGIEIALLERELLPDLVGHDVPDTAPVRDRRRELLSGKLLSEHDVPEAEFGPDTTVRELRHTPDDKCFRAGTAPVGKARHGIEVADPLDEAFW